MLDVTVKTLDGKNRTFSVPDDVSDFLDFYFFISKIYYKSFRRHGWSVFQVLFISFLFFNFYYQYFFLLPFNKWAFFCNFSDHCQAVQRENCFISCEFLSFFSCRRIILIRSLLVFEIIMSPWNVPYSPQEISATSQRLIFIGRVLQDEKKLNDYGMSGLPAALLWLL